MFRRYISPDEKLSILTCYLRGLEKIMKDLNDHDQNDLLYMFAPSFSKILASAAKFWSEFEDLKIEPGHGSPIGRDILEFGRIAFPSSQDYFTFGDEFARLLKKEINHLKKRFSPFMKGYELPDEIDESDWNFVIEKSVEAAVDGYYMPDENETVSTGGSDDRNKLKAKTEMISKPKFF